MIHFIVIRLSNRIKDTVTVLFVLLCRCLQNLFVVKLRIAELIGAGRMRGRPRRVNILHKLETVC